MTQRAVIWEFDEENGAMFVVNIIEWDDDNLKRNKRRLMREFRKQYSIGKYQLAIFQVPETGPAIYQRTIDFSETPR